MYVYVTKFEDRPNLIKIGKSTSPIARNATLSNWHGKVVYSDHYEIGNDYTAVESYLHNKYTIHNERIDGDGGTEFFSDIIYKDVTNYLTQFRTEEYKINNVNFLTGELKSEQKRYYDLIGKLLGYKYSDSHTGESYSMYVGFWDMQKIAGCYDMGFDPDEINKRYLLTHNFSAFYRRFTTPHRVGIAYKLYKEGTEKEKGIKQLLSAAIDRDRNLLQ